MPLFLSSEEYQYCSHDASLVAEKADSFIRELLNQLETVKAQADAASITAEQTCGLLDQKYVSLSADFASLQSQHSQLSATLDQRLAELAQLREENYQSHLSSIGKDGENERLSTDTSELRKSKRQLMDILEQKDMEISEKNSTIKSYLDKIVNLTEKSASKEARLCDVETQLLQSQASYARIAQEKELVERHNSWLNDELKTKVNDLIELRRTHGELEAEMSAKVSDSEKRLHESLSTLKWNKDKTTELESKLASLEQELIAAKDAAASSEKQFYSEISTLTKLVELYKESSEEWSNKAGELEGVIKALETQLLQVENDSKERLEKEVSARKEIEKEANGLKEKLDTCLTELESLRKSDEFKLPPRRSASELWMESIESSNAVEDNQLVMRNFPVGVSGTALAASLLRDGWSITKMYVKYQEAVDALRHEQLGRRQSEAVLERVLHEIEQKAGVILDERAELERTVESYSAIDQKLQDSLSEIANLQRHVQELEANLRRKDRENNMAQKEIADLQNQVSVLLKECQDIQLRCGSTSYGQSDSLMAVFAVPPQPVDDSEGPSLMLPFKDISGLVEQNVQLRHLVHSLSEDIVSQEASFKEKYERDLKKHMDEASAKVRAVLARAEEQQQMIESLHTSVAMYKKLYEEESHKLQSASSLSEEPITEKGRRDLPNVIDNTHEYIRQSHERVKCLEEELSKSRSEIISARSEADKLALEARSSQEKLERFMKDFDHQRDELNCVKARNDKLSQFVIDYQRKMRDSSESLNSAEEISRNLTMEMSLLKQEKEILRNSEKRASDEVRSLSERVHRLQASLDTIQSTEEIREEARCAERRKQESYIKKIEREWAEAKKELHDERDRVRRLTFERENGMNNALKQAEEAHKESSKVLRDLAAAEARALVAEARCSDLEEKIKVYEKNGKDASSSNVNNQSDAAKEEIAKLVEEAQMNKAHMLQYKSVAQANEEALKQLETAYEKFKAEADIVKKSLEADIVSLRETVYGLQEKLDMKSNELAVAITGKEEALASSLLEIASLRESCSVQRSEIVVLNTQITSLKDDLEKECKKSTVAQTNYERQVILQSDTIQELNKTSQALAELQEKASELQRSNDALKNENDEVKAKWETEKTMLEVLKTDADRKYDEVDELNKILHSRLEAVYIKFAENDRHSAGVSGSSSLSSLEEDDGFQNVVKYLRRSKEIAEAEIYLLKQERLRLQSQLEAALKAAQTAQASLDAERRNSKSFFFSEEEFTSLQLQVREISLLRESNVQLREENRQNFDECQKLREICEKLRIETESITKDLGEKQNEVEICRKDIEIQLREKEYLTKKVDELLESSKNVDVQEYDRMKDAVQQLQASLREKDTQLDDFRSLLSQRQESILCLEAEVSRSKLEINEKESRVNDLSQIEASLRADVDKHRRLSFQQKKKAEMLDREKVNLIKENQALSKQVEDFKQGKRAMTDGADEQAIKEKEKEKESRIQSLVRTVERLKDELKKEKDEHKIEKGRRGKMQRTVRDSYETVSLQRLKLTEELEKHKQGLKLLQNDVEKLKHGKDSQSEGSADAQFLSGTLLDDLSTAYHLAVENFQQATLPVLNEPVAHATESSPTLDATSAGPPIGQVPSTLGTSTSTSALSVVNHPTAKQVDEKEKNLTVTKPNVESRKIARRLVRPRISKPENTEVDVEMTEVEGLDSSAKPLSCDTVETQGSLSAALGQKRRASLELSEETLVAEVTTEPSVKKLKSNEGGEGLEPESNDGQEVTPEVKEYVEEESPDSLKDSGVDGAEQESADTDDLPPKQESPSDKVEEASDEVVVSGTEQENEQPTVESGSEREEGEMAMEDADPMGIGELQPEMMLAVDDESLNHEEDAVTEDAGDKNNDEASEVNPEKQQSTVESTVEPTVESTVEPTVESTVEPTVDSEEGKQVPSSLINLPERAKERASLRQAGMSPSSLPTRGRGRTARGRGRSARGQPSSKQG